MKKKIQVIVICSGIAEELKAVTASSINKLNEIGKKENVFYYNEPIIIEALDRKEEAVELNQCLTGDRKPEQVCDYLASFSYFRCPVTNTQPNAEMTIADVYAAIKSNKYKCQTVELRSIL